jgi:hypothetical protein
MVGRRLPLWLLLDPAAWLGLMLGVWRLVTVVRELLAAPDDGRGLLPEADLARMAEALAETEADIDWAIARRVRRLCGLPAGNVARVVPAPARTLRAFRARYDAQVRRMTGASAIAQRRAARAMRAGRRATSPPVADDFSDAFAGDAALGLPAGDGSASPCVRAGVQARAPPAICTTERYALQI